MKRGVIAYMELRYAIKALGEKNKEEFLNFIEKEVSNYSNFKENKKSIVFHLKAFSTPEYLATKVKLDAEYDRLYPKY